MENDQANENISLEDSARAVMQDLPDPIRRFIVSGGVETMTSSIVSKHNLRVDQGTVIEREMLLMLIGAHEPSTLMQTLQQDAGMDSQTASAVLQDVESLVFNPIHQEMTKLTAEKPAPASTGDTTAAATAPPQEAAVVPQTNAAVPATAPASPVPQPEPPAPQQPQMPPTSAANPITPPPPPAAPPTSTPRPPEPPPVPLTPKTPHQNTPLVNEYAVDPYREPVEEEGQ